MYTILIAQRTLKNYIAATLILIFDLTYGSNSKNAGSYISHNATLKDFFITPSMTIK